MSEQLPSIDLNISKKLKDRSYRQAFFLAESSALIAKQLIALRKRRGLNQTHLAQAIETGQPAISRVERADYRNWSFNTLRRLAEALDARLRVYIEPSEDVIAEYEAEEIQAAKEGTTASAAAEKHDMYGQITSQFVTGQIERIERNDLPARAQTPQRGGLLEEGIRRGAN